MKLLIIAACIFVVANGQLDQFRETFRKMLAECQEAVGASDADVDQYNHRVTPDSKAGRCMIACVNKIIGIQNEDGKINPDATREASQFLHGFDEKLYSTLLDINEICLNEDINGKDECDIGAQWFTCVSKGQDDAGIPPLL